MTEVPTLMQKGLVGLASGISGVAEAVFEAPRLISILHRAAGELQVVAALQMLWGLASEQENFGFLSAAARAAGLISMTYWIWQTGLKRARRLLQGREMAT